MIINIKKDDREPRQKSKENSWKPAMNLEPYEETKISI